MSDLNCQIEIPAIENLVDNQLTVGREFFIHCKGVWPKDFNLDKAQFVFEQEGQKYVLKLLQAQLRTVDDIDFKVTSYLAGKVAIPDLKVSDGEKTVSLGPTQFEVASVLDPKQQKPEPYGPIGPLSILWPLAYNLIIALLLGWLAALIARILWRKRKERQLRQKLRELETSLSPEAQFFKDFRQLKRENQIFYSAHTNSDILEARDKIDRMIRVFISREFRVLATELKSAKVISELKLSKIWIEKSTIDLESDVKRILVELERSKVDQEKIARSDVLQLVGWAQALVEKNSYSLVKSNSMPPRLVQLETARDK